MARRHNVTVSPLPHWLDRERFLGAGDFVETPGEHGLKATATLSAAEAADLATRLRNLGLGGHPLTIDIEPPLKRAVVRAARTFDAKRRRQTSPGFLTASAKSHPTGRLGLTPQRLADQMASGAEGRQIFDACCGLGGNTLAFAKVGARVLAVEHDREILGLAKHNAAVFGLTEQIDFQLGDALTLAPPDTDICFVDPPWGAEWNRLRCGLSDFPLAAALFATFQATPDWGAFWLKVPSSFDPSSLSGNPSTTAVFGHAAGDSQRIKCLLLKVASR
jgi:hypothetical protein